MELAVRVAFLFGVAFAGDTGASVDLPDSVVGHGLGLYNESSAKGGAGGNSTAEVDWGHVLPDSVQEVLPHILGKYGHLDALADPSTNAFLHALLPGAEKLGDESSTDAVPKGLAALLESATTEYRRAADWSTQRDARKAEREAAKNGAEQLARNTKREGSLAADEAAKAKDLAMRAELAQTETEELAKRKHEHQEFLMKQRHARKAWQKEHEANMEQRATLGERMEKMLMMVHDQIEEDSHGFTDMPFWDDFFRNTSAGEGWSRLSLEGLGPALNLPALRPEHRILILEPSESLGVAAQLADSLQATGMLAASHSYGTEPDDSFDLVLELGLLDAMAMSGAGDAKVHRLEELRRASQRLSGLLRPGGAWVSVSSVPPGLRLPLLERLAGGAFDVPSEDVGTHAVQLRAVTQAGASSASPKLRGKGLESQHVANLLLYGHKDPHVFAYRLPRVEASWTDSAFDAGALPSLEGIVAAQRSAAHDDL